MKNKQSFDKKVIDVIFILLILKLIYSLLSGFYLGTSEFIILIVSTVIFSLLLFYVLKRLANSEFNSTIKNGNGPESNVLLQSSVFNQIEQKYRDLAQEYVKNKEYKKAAHVYMKLLKDNYTASNVLYDGGLYIEAATVNLKYLKNESKAAECFEKGKAYKDALHLYKKLENHEKVGDMYMHMNELEEAQKAYYTVVDTDVGVKQYIKASHVLKDKIKAPEEAQELLLEGWEKNIQNKDCLQAYFQNLKDKNNLEENIQTIYDTKTIETNKESFFQVIKGQFGKNDKVNKTVRSISYEIVSQLMDKKPEIVSELNYLNAQNTSFAKDVMQYKLNRRKK
ncbi:hypothetical protein FIA58_008685 [Flavobacterium jejuense]|uniref:Uncharacterized protein n=1 Tax=Flavobacterium jejuense TaxID=1544455 RepID=A0ABX0IPX7_9FLAO|nr:hypothetical protein [Flavobacterium jejuense]NHN25748.1 hypothetical protein [Flavobacterium jejuense]